MKYLFSGILLGMCLSLFSFRAEPSVEIYPRYYLEKNSLQNLPRVKGKEQSTLATCRFNKKVFRIDLNGNLTDVFDLPESLSEFSDNGNYYISFEKVGSEIELHADSGERYWKIKSRERPFLSRNAKLILLLNGDQSRVRIMDRNGSLAGAGQISGRICTSVDFSHYGDGAAVGFADGSFYFLNSRGNVTFSGRTNPGTVVKSMAISNNGKYGALHYGDSNHDFIRIINIPDQEAVDVALKTVQFTRSAISVNNTGLCSFLDTITLNLYDSQGEVLFSRAVPKKRIGLAKVHTERNFTTLSYGLQRGGAQFYIFDNNGSLLFSKRFSQKSFLSCSLSEKEEIITLEDRDSLCAYILEKGN